MAARFSLLACAVILATFALLHMPPGRQLGGAELGPILTSVSKQVLSKDVLSQRGAPEQILSLVCSDKAATVAELMVLVGSPVFALAKLLPHYDKHLAALVRPVGSEPARSQPCKPEPSLQCTPVDFFSPTTQVRVACQTGFESHSSQVNCACSLPEERSGIEDLYLSCSQQGSEAGGVGCPPASEIADIMRAEVPKAVDGACGGICIKELQVNLVTAPIHIDTSTSYECNTVV